jgi:hypothetical protein
LQLRKKLVWSGRSEFPDTGRFDVSDAVFADIGRGLRRWILGKQGVPELIGEGFQLSGRGVENDLSTSAEKLTKAQAAYLFESMQEKDPVALRPSPLNLLNKTRQESFR